MAHGSRPCEPSSAYANTLSSPRADNPGQELAGPSRTSAASRVPADVPSVCHTSAPCTPSSAYRNIRWRPTTRTTTDEPAGPGRMSATSDVPAADPSVVHSSRPATGSVAAKYNRPFHALRPEGP